MVFHQMEKYWNIYDKLASNPSIPKAITSAIYSIVIDGQRGEYTEEQVESEIKDLTNKLKASCNFVNALLEE